ncbi:MAG: TonB-dependent receptor [Flammeovirgaceae bacterium]
MKNLILYCLLLFTIPSYAQIIVKGKVIDAKGKAVPFANVFLKPSFEGGSTDEEGAFSFTADAKGKCTIAVSCVGYQPYEKAIELVHSPFEVSITLAEAIGEMRPVVITAGTFEASNEKKATMLKPIDIVTTAGADGDIMGAIRTLPGVMNVGNETGVFVRGGEASETQVIIDGTLVRQPFFGDLPNIPQRSRFDPFSFKGTAFSTGGYSAEFGQALSSVLILNTTDLPRRTSTGFSILPLSWGVTHQNLINEQTSVGASFEYTNLGPYFEVTPQLVDWIKAPEAIGGSLSYRHQTKNKGIWKSFLRYGKGTSGIGFDNLDSPGERSSFQNTNQNLYSNHSFISPLGKNWNIRAGLAFSYDEQDIEVSENDLRETDLFGQGKFVLEGDLNDRQSLKVGVDLQRARYRFQFNDSIDSTLPESYAAGFAEWQSVFGDKFAIQSGLRWEYSHLLGKMNLATRTSLAYKTGINSQVSFAYGKFYQLPEHEFLGQAPTLGFEKATHYILNYQWLASKKTFRIETYYKNYDQLTKENPELVFDNSGYGFAKGIDLFWRDQESIQNLDYWISYSFVDSKRNFLDFPQLTTPTFISEHTLNVVLKYNISSASFGATYTYASGRSYFNPNNSDYLADRTSDFHNFNINGSYVTNIKGHFTVIFASVNNVFNRKNVFGYRYSADGSVRSPIHPAGLRTFFVGCFISVAKKTKAKS